MDSALQQPPLAHNSDQNVSSVQDTPLNFPNLATFSHFLHGYIRGIRDLLQRFYIVDPPPRKRVCLLDAGWPFGRQGRRVEAACLGKPPHHNQSTERWGGGGHCHFKFPIEKQQQR